MEKRRNSDESALAGFGLANKYDAYNKVKKVIKTGDRLCHGSSINNLIENFRVLYGDEGLSRELRDSFIKQIGTMA